MYVRLGLERDEDAVVALARVACEQNTPHLTYREDLVRNAYRRYLATANPTFFLVDQEGAVIGGVLASMSSYWHAAGLIVAAEVVFVQPDKRGTRAAALLLAHLVEWGKMLGANEITGGSDTGMNGEQVARLYERFGFQRVGYLMRRSL